MVCPDFAEYCYCTDRYRTIKPSGENDPTRQPLFQEIAETFDPQNDCRGQAVEKTRV